MHRLRFLAIYLCFCSVCTSCSQHQYEDSPLEAQAFIQPEFPANTQVPPTEPPIPESATPKEQKTAFDFDNLATQMLRPAVVGAWFGARKRLSCEGFPKNSRQTDEGYWLGSRPDPEELEEISA